MLFACKQAVCIDYYFLLTAHFIIHNCRIETGKSKSERRHERERRKTTTTIPSAPTNIEWNQEPTVYKLE